MKKLVLTRSLNGICSYLASANRQVKVLQIFPLGALTQYLYLLLELQKDRKTEKEQEKQQQQKEQQPQEKEDMSKEDAEKMLEALQQQERELQEKLQKKKVKGKKVKVLKDW